MAGVTVSRNDLDWKASRTVLAIREAFENSEVIYNFLAQYPSNAEGGDHLTKPLDQGGFGYTDDEAYLIRLVFEQLHALDIEPILEQGSKLTGLE